MSKIIIVTGAGGYMGKAVIRHLTDNGNTVVGTVSPGKKRNPPNYQQYEEHEVDVSDPKAVNRLVQHVVKKYKRIDFAALLAGGFAIGDITKTTLEDIHTMFSVNFETAFVTAQAIFNQMKQQPSGGHLMLVGAKPALEPSAASGAVAYVFSKSLVFKLAESINESGKKYKIKASVIVPSILDTPPNREAMPNANYEDWVKPEDMAAIINFLVSEESAPIKESIIKVYGNV